MTQSSAYFFKFKFLAVTKLYLKHLLKCYHKVHEIVEINELNVNCNHSYRTRSKIAQRVISKSAKTKLLTMSLEYRGRVLMNFLLQNKDLTTAEKWLRVKFRILSTVSTCVQETCFLFRGVQQRYKNIAKRPLLLIYIKWLWLIRVVLSFELEKINSFIHSAICRIFYQFTQHSSKPS